MRVLTLEEPKVGGGGGADTRAHKGLLQKTRLLSPSLGRELTVCLFRESDAWTIRLWCEM